MRRRRFGAGIGVQQRAQRLQILERAPQQFLGARVLGARFGERLAGRTFAVWGLAFKPNTDDMREAPSRVLIEQLLEAGARVRAYDPEAGHEASRLFGTRDDVSLCADPFAALEGADALAILTEWKAFWSPDFARIKAKLREPVVFDGRNIYEPAAVEAAGLAYYGIGRGRTIAAPT